jgi:hypothetical protein
MSGPADYSVRPPSPGGEVPGLLPVSPNKDDHGGRKGPQGKRKRPPGPPVSPPPPEAPTKTPAPDGDEPTEKHSVDYLA